VEASDGAVEADGGALVVEVDDRAALAVEVARADGVVDAHLIADAQFSKRVRRADGVKEVVAGVDGVGERGEVLVEIACCDRVE